MAKLTILRGISGSGKSTWARQQFATVVSRDDLRDMYAPVHRDNPEAYYALDKSVLAAHEQTITVMQDSLIAGLLKAGKDVIVDNTNIEWKYVKALAKMGHRHGAEVEVKVFDVDFATAAGRDAARGLRGGRRVGSDIIRKQHSRFQGSKDKVLDAVVKPAPYSGTPGKPKAILVDVDGTLAHMHDYRSPYDWKSVGKDDVDENVAQVVEWIWLGMNEVVYDTALIIMSGRDEVCRKETEDWLDAAWISYDHLFMRPEGDMRADNIVKAELFDKYVRDNFDVVMVFDDRNQVVDMWRAMGVKVAQVAEGDF